MKMPQHKKVLKAAAELFASEGFAAVGMRAIAKRASTSIGTIYHYFEGKREILDVVLREEIEARKQLLSTLRDQDRPFEEQVQQLLLTHFALLKESPDATKVYFQERLYAGSLFQMMLQNLHEEVIEYIEGLLREGIRAGGFVPCNTTVAAHAIVGLIEALSRKALDGDDTAELIIEQGPKEIARLLTSWLRVVEDDKSVDREEDDTK